jgi:hypothetical protein
LFRSEISISPRTDGLRDFLGTWNYAWHFNGVERLDEQSIRYGDLKLVQLFNKNSGQFQNQLYNLSHPYR